MRPCDLVIMSSENLLVIRKVYCDDIKYLKSHYIKDGDNTFVLNYINILEEEINSINLELIERGAIQYGE